MATVKKSMKKYQAGGPVASKKKAVVDSVDSEMFPGKRIPKSKSNYENGNYSKMLNPPKKAAVPKKKMKAGGELGMKSVKAGYDKNPGVTRADIIVAGKKEAKHGAKMMKMGGAAAKQAAIAIAMKKAGKTPKKKMQYGGAAASMVPKKAMGGMRMMKGGGKCKYGC
jgi:hypothetical protein